MSKKIFKISTIFAVVIFLWAGCDYKPSSFGDFQKIVVYADSSVFKNIQPQLEQIFDQYLYTPHLERSFLLDLRPLHELEIYKTRRNLLFIGILNEKEPVSQFVSRSLSEQTKQAVEEGKVFEIFKEDVFATDQVVMFFPATSVDQLRKNLSDRGQIIFDQFNQLYYRLLKKSMFSNGEQKEMEDYLAEKYGWKIRVQHDYEVVKETDDGSFVWLRRLNPDRSLFIYRFKTDHFDMNQKELYALRDSLTTVFYEADSIDKADTYIQAVKFNGLEAQKLVGVWQNQHLLIGGAFRSYVFYDNLNKYVYFIDLTVTAPGKRKKPLLDQLEVIAHTFKLPDQ